MGCTLYQYRASVACTLTSKEHLLVWAHWEKERRVEGGQELRDQGQVSPAWKLKQTQHLEPLAQIFGVCPEVAVDLVLKLRSRAF